MASLTLYFNGLHLQSKHLFVFLYDAIDAPPKVVSICDKYRVYLIWIGERTTLYICPEISRSGQYK